MPDPSQPSGGETESPAIQPSEQSAESSGLPPNVAAGIACIFSIVGGVVFLVIEKKNAFVRFYAMQSIFLGIVSIAMGAAFSVLELVFVHIPIFGWIVLLALGLLHLLLALGVLAAYIITIIQSFSGKEWEIPYIGKFARKQLK